MKKTLLLISVVASLFTSCLSDKGDLPKPIVLSDTAVHYNTTIKPIIFNNCASCHGSAGPQSDLTNFTTLQADTTNVVLRITGQGAIMPQSGPLSSGDIGLIKTWVKQGALPN